MNALWADLLETTLHSLDDAKSYKPAVMSTDLLEVYLAVEDGLTAKAATPPP